MPNYTVGQLERMQLGNQSAVYYSALLVTTVGPASLYDICLFTCRQCRGPAPRPAAWLPPPRPGRGRPGPHPDSLSGTPAGLIMALPVSTAATTVTADCDSPPPPPPGRSRIHVTRKVCVPNGARRLFVYKFVPLQLDHVWHAGNPAWKFRF